MCLWQRKGLVADPQLLPQLEYQSPVLLLWGQQQARMHSNCLKGGRFKAHHKMLWPEARKECFHETSVGYKTLGVQTAIK